MTKYLHGARALGTPADVNTDGQTLLSGYAKRFAGGSADVPRWRPI